MNLNRSKPDNNNVVISFHFLKETEIPVENMTVFLDVYRCLLYVTNVRAPTKYRRVTKISNAKAQQATTFQTFFGALSMGHGLFQR